MASTLLAMASNLEAMSSTPKAFVTGSFLLLVVLASTPKAFVTSSFLLLAPY